MAPPSLSLSLSFLFPPVEKGKGGQILLGLGVQVGIPLGAPLLAAGLSPPSFIYVARGTPIAQHTIS